MMLSESVWDNFRSAEAGVGNTVVWPNRPGTPCHSVFWGGQGWTWYVYLAEERSGSRRIIESGLATIANVDGHVRAVRYPHHERCEFFEIPERWHHPSWVPWY